jgi:hypothetical protein
MADETLQLLTADDGYLLKLGDEVSESTDYGSFVTAEMGGRSFLAFADLPENSRDLEFIVYEGKDVTETVEVVEPDEEERSRQVGTVSNR